MSLVAILLVLAGAALMVVGAYLLAGVASALLLGGLLLVLVGMFVVPVRGDRL